MELEPLELLGFGASWLTTQSNATAFTRSTYPVMIEPEAFGRTKEEFIFDMLHERGVKVGMHYIPLHWTTAFERRGYRRGQFPEAEKAGERLVTLPINPRQSWEALDYLIESVHAMAR